MTDKIPLKDLKLKCEPVLIPHTMIWGGKVSPEFREAMWSGCRELCLEPDPIMACIAFETGKTFSPNVKNIAGSGATGLIQFMPDTARFLGTSIEELEHMTAEQQLVYVFKHFKPYADRLVLIEDYYMTILMPSKIGKPLDDVLFRQDYYNRKNLKAYIQNKGLDKNFDGKITKAEAAYPVRECFEAGKRWIK